MPPLVFLADAADASAVWTTPADVLHPGEGGVAIKPIVGTRSFMLADESEHLRGRAILREAFSARTAHRHVAVLREMAEREVATWPRDRPIALYARLRALALRVVMHTVFGDDPSTAELHERLLSMLDMTASPVLGAPPTRHFPPYRRVWRRFLRDRDDVDDLLFGLIDDRRLSRAGRNDTLSLLLAAQDERGEPLSTEYVRDSVMSVILAGHETTSSAMAWAFQLLAHHPRVQAQLEDELRRAGDGPTPYLTATIDEVLRHRPVFVFAIPRSVTAPLEVAGRRFEHPVHLLPCIYLIHHDPSAYPSPDVFRPERFLGTVPNPGLWVPWGGGRKRCPGRHLAREEMEAVIRAVVSTAVIHPAASRMEPARWRSVIVTPGRGGRVMLRQRTAVGRRG
jgi:cytochrome P450